MKAYKIEISNNGGVLEHYIVLANAANQAVSKGLAAGREEADEDDHSVRVTLLEELSGEVLK